MNTDEHGFCRKIQGSDMESGRYGRTPILQEDARVCNCLLNFGAIVNPPETGQISIAYERTEYLSEISDCTKG